MGYDVKVMKSDFKRWFSIWDWNRCMLFALYGADIIDDDKFVKELYSVLDLENNGVPTDPEEYAKYQVAIEIDRKSHEEDGKEITIIHHDFQYDDEGYVVGSMVICPLPGHEDKTEEELVKHIEGLQACILVQAKTNNLLVANHDALFLSKVECRKLAVMSGEPISADVAMRIMVSVTCGLAKCFDLSKPSEDEIPTLSVGIPMMFEMAGFPEEMIKSLGGLIATQEAHEPSFDFQEYLDDDSVFALMRFISVMGDAAGNLSDFIIT